MDVLCTLLGGLSKGTAFGVEQKSKVFYSLSSEITSETHFFITTTLTLLDKPNEVTSRTPQTLENVLLMNLDASTVIFLDLANHTNILSHRVQNKKERRGGIVPNMIHYQYFHSHLGRRL